jgi:hypothetical protein
MLQVGSYSSFSPAQYELLASLVGRSSADRMLAGQVQTTPGDCYNHDI